MNVTLTISINSLLVACLCAIYSRRSAHEAQKANELLRLNTLLELKKHLLEQMRHQESLATALKNLPSGMKAIHEKYADLDSKLRFIDTELALTNMQIDRSK